MFGEVFIAANDHLLFEDNSGEKYKISKSIWNMNVYQQLTDSVLERILWSKDPALKTAQKILMDVQSRRLYRCIGQMMLAPEQLRVTDLFKSRQ